MTYIVGWKHNGIAYLCADSALTTHDTEPTPMMEPSSFGEAPINLERRQVSERSVKILNFGRAVVAVSGSVANANSVLISLRDELRHVENIRVAFAHAIEDCLLDDESKASVQFILAAPNNIDVTMLFYNTDGRGNIGEVAEDHIVNFGSIRNEKRRLTCSLIAKIATSTEVPGRQLASVLGLLQSFGVNQNLFDDGVGGAFYGGYVTATEFKWQSDILYIIRQPGNYWTKLVATSIRDDAVVVKSGINKEVVLLANTLSVGFTSTWMSKWSSHLTENHELADYDFVTFLTAGYPNCTVVEMLKQKQSLHLRMPTTARANDGGRLYAEMELSQTLATAVDAAELEAVNGQLRPRVTFFEYEPLGSVRLEQFTFLRNR
jgi:hypothetical protein